MDTMTLTHTQKILTLLILIIFTILLINFHPIRASLEANYYIYEHDAYLHMVNASEILQHHAWSSHFTKRINAPYGSDTHAWTQVINFLLVGCTWISNRWMNLSSSLYLWSFILPMIFFGLAACALLWVINITKPTFFQQIFILLAFLLNPFINTFLCLCE